MSALFAEEDPLMISKFGVIAEAETKFAKLSYERSFIKMNNDKRKNTFAALKFIEQLYLDGCIPKYVYLNILNEYKGVFDLSSFSTDGDLTKKGAE